jgi:DHA2 family multidrug resistance protein-like MFS transporter
VSETTDGLPPPQRRRALLTLAIAVSMSVLDGSIANVALPTIAHNLDVTPAASIWVVNSFQIAVMISLLPFSSLGDIYGYRRIYTIGLAVFTAASLFSALSTSLTALSLSRALQGFGGAGLMSVNTALVRYIFPRAQLGRAMGFNAMIVATSSALGPSVAAAILSVASWPWLFLVNVPFGLLALALTGSLPAPRRGGHRFDIPSALLSAATFGLFIATLDGPGHGGSRLIAAIGFLAFAAVAVVFVRRQNSLKAPMLPVDLFRRPIFALTVATSVCSFTGQTIAYVAIPFLFQSVGGLSDTGTGLLMTPWPATVAVIAPIAGRLADKYPAGLLGGLGLATM